MNVQDFNYEKQLTPQTESPEYISGLIAEAEKHMNAAGVFPDERGQYDFADVVFYDPELSNERKIEVLEMIGGQDERIAQLAKIETRQTF